MTKLPLCVMTQVYDEPDFLPLWFKYYSRQVGAENCYIIDHGSSDFSVQEISRQCPVLRIPRENHNDLERARLISRMSAALLLIYETVIYGDVDEIIVADPAVHRDLLEAAQNVKSATGVTTMLGCDIIHDLETEGPIDVDRKILRQRNWMRPLGFLCKPSMIKRPVEYASGFHTYDGGCVFDHLYLFHLAYFDRSIILRRQQKRNRSAPVDGGGGHHRHSPENMLTHFANGYKNLSRKEQIDLSDTGVEREELMNGLFGGELPKGDKRIQNYPYTPGLWQIPERFRDVF